MKKIVLFLISICLLNSCESKKPDVRSCSGKKPVTSVLNTQEWFPYADSIHTVSYVGKVTYLDSVSKYFMKVNTPNVISEPKYIFWHNGKQISNGEFAFFEQVSDSLMVIDKSSDSIFFLEIYNIDSNLVGKYSILPVSLSKEKVKDYEYWAFRSSCIIGALNPKVIKYKNYIFRPKCGFNHQNDKDLLNKFYVALE